MRRHNLGKVTSENIINPFNALIAVKPSRKEFLTRGFPVGPWRWTMAGKRHLPAGRPGKCKVQISALKEYTDGDYGEKGKLNSPFLALLN